MSASDQRSADVPHDSEILIGGRWVKPATGATAPVTSAASGQVVATLPDASPEDGAAAVTAALAAFTDGCWRALSVGERLEAVHRFRRALEERIEQFNRAWSIESGIPISLAESFAQMSWLIADENLKLAEDVPLRETRATAAGTVEIRHEPLGPVLVILTYNGPLIEIGMAVIPALAVGNTVIVKLPPESRMVGHVLADAVAAAEFPAGVFSIITADVEVSRRLVADARVAAVHFTGGTEIGADVATSCAKRIAHVTLELGGKAAAIMADDVDFDEVLPTLLSGMTPYQGQLCVAVTRVLVSRQRHDELVEKLVAAFGSLKVGDPLDPATEFGPLPGEKVRSRSERYIASAVDQGARIAHGGKRPAALPDGFYLEPTLLTNVRPDMDVFQNEIFGPVYCVIPYDSMDEAVTIANDTKYGLASSIYTNDMALADDVASRVDVGAFGINGSFPCLTAPYGGVKQSGYGRACGVEGLLELTRIKTILNGSS
jgi:acyl-CoA reductase-like NAD-dependent aldehyde dehydrogenase